VILKIACDADGSMVVYRWIESLGWVLYQQGGFVNGRPAP